ncbi:MAG: hypothetical protein ACHQNA_09280, partial [Acidimicrobiales bacterium]
YLTGPSGLTLYTLSSDPTNGSICTGGCLTFWPPLVIAAGGTVSAPSGVTRTFSMFTRTDTGASQVTVDGHALYYFKNDSAPGDTKGEGIVALGGTWHVAAAAASNPPATTGFLSSLPTVDLPGHSTVPANGDINPYGDAVVPHTMGRLVRGDILVSNFNAKSNRQGTGTTIVELEPNGARHLFATITPSSVAGRCPGGVGLTTALVALSSGWVIVGSLPTRDGTAATARAGCLIVLDSSGHVVETFQGGSINGPWDMTAWDGGAVAELFVSNVLNGTVAAKGRTVHHGTVVRIALQTEGVRVPRLLLETVIGSGFGERTDPDALVVGPTGLGLASDGTLYVADTLDSRIAAIRDAAFRTTSAGAGTSVTRMGWLNQPLGLALAPNGDILTVNAGDGNIVETTPAGAQVVNKTLDSTGGGGGLLFGLAVRPDGKAVYFVDDGTNTLALLH